MVCHWKIFYHSVVADGQFVLVAPDEGGDAKCQDTNEYWVEQEREGGSDKGRHDDMQDKTWGIPAILYRLIVHVQISLEIPQFLVLLLISHWIKMECVKSLSTFFLYALIVIGLGRQTQILIVFLARKLGLELFQDLLDTGVGLLEGGSRKVADEGLGWLLRIDEWMMIGCVCKVYWSMRVGVVYRDEWDHWFLYYVLAGRQAGHKRWLVLTRFGTVCKAARSQSVINDLRCCLFELTRVFALPSWEFGPKLPNPFYRFPFIQAATGFLRQLGLLILLQIRFRKLIVCLIRLQCLYNIFIWW